MAGEGNDFSDFFASTILPYDFCGDKQSHLIKSFDVLSDVYILYCKIDIMQIDRKKKTKDMHLCHKICIYTWYGDGRSSKDWLKKKFSQIVITPSLFLLWRNDFWS